MTTLDAPVACSHDHDEEMTYLDRDQAYLISITDSAPSPVKIALTYRTSIQLSFENDEQTSRSAYYWTLWQSRHVSTDDTMVSRPLRGLEFAASSAVFSGIDQNVSIHLESTAVDSFTFTWTTMPIQNPRCQFAVSFHFVSTDFSQAKGVKGLPLRLSALTREITLALMEESRHDLQISQCLIKVYRNHGAERKKAIDCKQMQRKIEKVKQRIASQENALRAKSERDQHKRQKLSSEDSPSQPKLMANHVLVAELERLEVAANRRKAITVFHLRGQPEDYSDRCPTEDSTDLLKTSIDEHGNNTSLSMQPSPTIVVSSNFQITPQPNEWNTLERVLGMASPISNSSLDPAPSPSLIQTVRESKSPVKSVKWIKVIDVDTSYRRPEPLPPKTGA